MSARHWKKRFTDVDPLDFSPGLLRIQAQPPTPFARALLYSLLTLLALLLVWAVFGKLDVVASASGKLLPQSYLKIIHTGEPGKSGSNLPFAYRALIDLKAQHLIADGVRHALTGTSRVS